MRGPLIIPTELPGYFVPAPVVNLCSLDVVFFGRLYYIVQLVRDGYIEAYRVTTKEILQILNAPRTTAGLRRHLSTSPDVDKPLELITADVLYVWATHPQRWLLEVAR